MFRSPVVAPGKLASEYILRPLQPFKADQRCSSGMWLTHIAQRQSERIVSLPRSRWFRFFAADPHDAAERIFHRNFGRIEPAHHIPGPARNVDREIRLPNALAAGADLDG